MKTVLEFAKNLLAGESQIKTEGDEEQANLDAAVEIVKECKTHYESQSDSEEVDKEASEKAVKAAIKSERERAGAIVDACKGVNLGEHHLATLKAAMEHDGDANSAISSVLVKKAGEVNQPVNTGTGHQDNPTETAAEEAKIAKEMEAGAVEMASSWN